MDTSRSLTLEVIEVLHYCSDVDTAVEFYHSKLGWPVIWQFKGSMAGIDAGGAYLLTLVAAKLTEGWREGAPVPTPKLALQSKDLKADSAALQKRGLAPLDITGDPATMLSADLATIEGIELFVWQDTAGSPATKVVGEYKATLQPKAIYPLGECVFFVNDKLAAEEYFTTKLGFEVTERHGDAYCAMKLNGGPILGLYHWPDWWDRPGKDTPKAAARLFLESPDIAAEHSRQVSAGINPDGLKSNDGGLHWFKAADPDGTEMTFWQFKG